MSSQQILVGIILVGRLGALSQVIVFETNSLFGSRAKDSRFVKEGVQWKQGVVVHIIL